MEISCSPLQDPRFLPGRFECQPTWLVLEIYDRILKRRIDSANEVSIAPAKAALLQMSRESQEELNRVYGQAWVAFLPYPAAYEKRSSLFADLTLKTCQVFLALNKDRLIPPWVISVIAESGLLNEIKSTALQ